MFKYFWVSIYQSSLSQAVCDTLSLFKWSTTGDIISIVIESKLGYPSSNPEQDSLNLGKAWIQFFLELWVNRLGCLTLEL